MVPAVTAEQVEIRSAEPRDAADIHRLVRKAGNLDVNSRYYYLMWCRDFGDTSVVAELDRRPIGFVTGYLRPDAPDTYFAWQSAVDDDAAVPGLARAMMAAVIERSRKRGARHFETTVNPGNRAVKMLIRTLAHQHDARVTTRPLFGEAELGPGHEPEILCAFTFG